MGRREFCPPKPKTQKFSHNLNCDEGLTNAFAARFQLHHHQTLDTRTRSEHLIRAHSETTGEEDADGDDGGIEEGKGQDVFGAAEESGKWQGEISSEVMDIHVMDDGRVTGRKKVTNFSF